METLMQQWLTFQKIALDNSFHSMAQLQDYMTQQIMTYLGQNPMLPEEGKKAILEWIETYRKSRDEFKARADASYKKAESFFSRNGG